MKSIIRNIQHITGTVAMIILTGALPLLFSACDSNDPEKEDVPELITKITLTFTPQAGTSVVVTATDPDGEGVQPIQVDDPIVLKASRNYSLSIGLVNGLARPSDPEYNITEEVEEEADEHIFYFSWINNVFADPSGNGNIDNASDVVNYEDEDVNGLPLGLITSWSTAAAGSGNLRVMLKHQPDLKSTASDSNIGDTDVDITFPVTIE